MGAKDENDIGAGWHLDKRVPIAIIVAIMIQTAGYVWWTAKLDARVAALEDAKAAANGQEGRIIRLETRLDGITDTLKNMDAKLDRLLPFGPTPTR